MASAPHRARLRSGRNGSPRRPSAPASSPPAAPPQRPTLRPRAFRSTFCSYRFLPDGSGLHALMTLLTAAQVQSAGLVLLAHDFQVAAFAGAQENRMHRAEIEMARRASLVGACRPDQPTGLQRGMDHEAGVMFDTLCIGQVVMNAMRIEGQRRVAKQQRLAQRDLFM